MGIQVINATESNHYYITSKRSQDGNVLLTFTDISSSIELKLDLYDLRILSKTVEKTLKELD